MNNSGWECDATEIYEDGCPVACSRVVDLRTLEAVDMRYIISDIHGCYDQFFPRTKIWKNIIYMIF